MLVLSLAFFLIVFSNPFFFHLCLLILESTPVQHDELKDNYHLGIVLTGFTDLFISSSDYYNLLHDTNRLISAMELYKNGRIKKIIIVGGQGSNYFPDKLEATVVKNFLIRMGFPSEDVLVESDSKNTAQSAKFVAKIIKTKFPNQHLLLITSATHMKRANLCFKKQGVFCDLFPTDFKGMKNLFSKNPSIYFSLSIPSLIVLLNWQIILKELVGLAVYKWRGDI